MHLRFGLTKLLQILGLPGTLYTQGKYKYLRNATIFPARNASLLRIASGINLQDAFFNVWDEITLEEGVVLGHQVMFLTGRHAVDKTGVQQEARSAGKILVKRNAWLGSRAIILGNVIIGGGSVIGAGSVVTHSVPDHEFWAGNPAQFIRHLDVKEIQDD